MTDDAAHEDEESVGWDAMDSGRLRRDCRQLPYVVSLSSFASWKSTVPSAE